MSTNTSNLPTPSEQEESQSNKRNDDPPRFLPVHEQVLKERAIDLQVAWDAGLRSRDFNNPVEERVWKKKHPGHPTYPSTAMEIPSASWSKETLREIECERQPGFVEN